jgi:hypothetical protein
MHLYRMTNSNRSISSELRSIAMNRLRPCFATRECWYLSVFEYQYLVIRKISVSVIFIYQ